MVLHQRNVSFDEQKCTAANQDSNLLANCRLSRMTVSMPSAGGCNISFLQTPDKAF